MCLFNKLQHYEEMNNPYTNMNEQTSELTILIWWVPTITAVSLPPHEAAYEHDNRWVWYRGLII